MSKDPTPDPTPLPLSARARRTADSPVSSLMAAAIGNPDLISLAAGLVDAETLPVAECSAIARRIFADVSLGRAALQYDTTLGLKPLRERLLTHLEHLENRPAASMGLSADQMILTTGSQQALYLLAECLVDAGDIVITANPSYFVFTGTLQSAGARVIAAPMDSDGMNVDAVGRILARLDADHQIDRVRFIYCTSWFDNPTGLTLSAPRRSQLVQLARQYSRRHRILIIEDAAYRELSYEPGSAGLPSIKSFDPENRYTVLTQTFSKPFAPGLKLGYTVMPRDLVSAVAHQKGNHDFGSPSLCQHIALEAMASGAYAEHLKVLRSAYQRKRDAMLAALERHMPAGVSWTRPAGGLYVWLTLPVSIDASRPGSLFENALAHGVLFVPGDYCFHPDDAGRIPTNHLRLSFGQVAMEKIEDGIARLGAAIRGEMRRSDSTALRHAAAEGRA